MAIKKLSHMALSIVILNLKISTLKIKLPKLVTLVHAQKFIPTQIIHKNKKISLTIIAVLKL